MAHNLIKAVVFDMDGLMFDTERVFIKAWDYAGEKAGLGKAGYMVYKTLGTNKEETSRLLKEEFGESDNVEALWKYSSEFMQKYYTENKVQVKKGLYVLLDYLKEKRYKLAVASSTSRTTVERYLKEAGISDCFEAVVCGDMIEKSKPEPDIYIKACERIGTPPHECYALEDSRNGLLSAYRAGCKVIMVPDLWQPDEEMKSILWGQFESLEEVKKYLESLE